VNPHLKYLVYVLKHKWHVFWQCVRFRHVCKGLVARGFWHDITKFNPACWSPYVDKFMRGDPSQVSDIVQTQFRKAFEDHWSTENHHWEYWCHELIPGRPFAHRETEPRDMEDAAIIEMICDWRAMALRNGGTADLDCRVENWYNSMKDKMRLSHSTRWKVESFFGGVRKGHF